MLIILQLLAIALEKFIFLIYKIIISKFKKFKIKVKINKVLELCTLIS